MATPNPNGCRHCGIEQDRPHARQWTPDAGWHTWEQPTQEQINDRMRVRQAARTERIRHSGPDVNATSQHASEAKAYTLARAALGNQSSPPDHSECIGPHLAPDGEHIDCDGNLL
ncbi:hypothetical protein [Streptomyces sp. NPDC058629]|uniref:hypothetical protein n=1 Tax=Streptomyces sp. NPDC058629 TaxID=3346565 RepID=UPI0036529076